ncbi:MAG: sulfatase [Solirubrobacterales bacterium]|nr:sulfatase [Solirubrobacterales bacterium]
MNATRWRPVFTVALFSALPFAVFLNANRADLDFDAILGLYALVLFVPGVVVLIVADRRRGPVARERAAVVFAAAAFVLFQFQFARSLADVFGLDSDPVAVAIWVALFAAAVVLAIRISRHSLAWNYAAVAGALLLALPVVQYAHFRATTPAFDLGASATPTQLSRPGAQAPDVYFFLLDGYGRADQLEQTIGFDNAAFLGALARRGFQVHEKAAAAYPVTFLSLAATLSMGYPAAPGELEDHTPFFDAVGGDNEVVDAFHRLGYEFAFASDYSSFDCGEQVDLCIEPRTAGIEGVGGEREVAILGATPLATLLPALGLHLSPLRGYLSPQDVVREVARERSGEPLFAYAHLLTPHPPYRYLEGCGLREDLTEPEIDYWGEAAGEGGEQYRQAIECVNRSLLRAIDGIEAEDPNAIIVIQGDHGPKFGIDFHRPLSDWSQRQLDTRFAIMNAQRLPARCARESPRAGLAVNTFRIILGCIVGKRLPLLRPRELMIDLEQGEVEQVNQRADRSTGA